ncbi:MAG TPA: GNAT family N-acetyltransferase [Gaiellaceae bacterium]|nr:GNAT family N-acetyltransferase [Gaiellaceae bacterium]
MEVVQPADAAEWLRRAEPLLLADEARYNLILGLAGTLRDQPGLYPDFGLWLVEEAGVVAGAALRTRPYNLVLGPASDESAALLAQAIDEELPGVVGALPEVDRFVAASGRAAETRFRQGIYALREVVPPRPAPGGPRPATADDRNLLLQWWHAFAVEALRDSDPDRERLARSVDHRLESPEGGIALWEDEGRPVAAVGFGSPTPTGVRIGPVYTPPELRGRGYASALTAHVSAEQLAAGRSFCFLYTDLANPTSNRIYVALGYERVCDSVEYAFR